DNGATDGGENEAPFVAVTDITGVAPIAEAGVPLALSATVVPPNATNQAIVWTVADAGETGAVIPERSNVLTASAAGTVTVTATIVNGATETTLFAKDFDITVYSAEEMPSVLEVKVSPSSASVVKGGTQAFTATVSGTNLEEEHKTVTWTVTGSTNPLTGISAAGLLSVAADEAASSLTVTAASTADSAKSGTASVTVIDEDNGSGAIQVSTWAQFASALSAVEDGGIISIEAGSVLKPDKGAVVYSKISFTIEGNGSTIDGSDIPISNSDTAVLAIPYEETKITIRALHFTNCCPYNGTNELGGAIFNVGELTLESCIFSNNVLGRPESYGGAVYSSGVLNVFGCTFFKNTANYGTAIYSKYTGQNSAITILGNLFYLNTSGWDVIQREGISMVPLNDHGYNVIDCEKGQSILHTVGSNSWYETRGGWPYNSSDIQIQYEDYEDGLPPFYRLTYMPNTGRINAVPANTPDFPTKDYYGRTREFNGGLTAAGAVSGRDDDFQQVTLKIANVSEDLMEDETYIMAVLLPPGTNFYDVKLSPKHGALYNYMNNITVAYADNGDTETIEYDQETEILTVNLWMPYTKLLEYTGLEVFDIWLMFGMENQYYPDAIDEKHVIISNSGISLDSNPKVLDLDDDFYRVF
ncbi:MAG: Ig-like domain-containing protein, partial [Treponema sp.]|nr:Ig-like domain-containing protein [Treponema sp.]